MEYESVLNELSAAFGSASASDALRELCDRVPATIREELLVDGAPDVEITLIRSRSAIDRLVEPLETRSFPEDDLFDLASLLSWILLNYSDKMPDDSAEKVAYISLFYLHCYVHEASITQAGQAPGALALLVDAAQDIDVRFTVAVLRFCLSALNAGFKHREDAPEFHFAVAAMCLLQQCVAIAGNSVGESLASLGYYKEAVVEPGELSARIWARRWRELLNSATGPEAERLSMLCRRIIEELHC